MFSIWLAGSLLLIWKKQLFSRSGLVIYLPEYVSLDKTQYQEIYILTSLLSSDSLGFIWVIWVALFFHLNYLSILFCELNSIFVL